MVDGRNPANQLRLVVYPIIYREFYIPGGAGFLPSTVFTCSSLDMLTFLGFDYFMLVIPMVVFGKWINSTCVNVHDLERLL